MKAVFNHRQEVDGLRSIAVLTVILYHAKFNLFSGGYVGVDVFFVISGYLISSIIYKECLNGNFSFIHFYERRIRRIFPMIFLILLLTAIGAFLIYSPKLYRNFSQSLFSTVTYSSNFYFWKKTGYFSQTIDFLPLIHTWSLAVEEQFYIIFPVVFFICYKFFTGYLKPIVIAGVLLSLLACLFLFEGWNQFSFFFMPTRAWELLAGTMLALNKKRYYGEKLLYSKKLEVISIIGMLMVLYSAIAFDDFTKYPGPLTIIPVLGTVFIIASAIPETIIGKLLSNKYIVYAGLMSYSAYLIHQPLFVFTREIFKEELTSTTYIILILLTFLLSHFTLKFVETPFRKQGVYNRKAIFRMALTVSCIFILLGLAGHFSGGFQERFTKHQQSIASTASFSPYREKCHTEGIDFMQPAKACQFFENTNTSWAVFGDSHGVELSYALAETLKAKKQGVLQLTSSGCYPAYTFTSTLSGCTEWIQQSTKRLISDSAIKNVILVFRHSFYLSGDQLASYPNVREYDPVFLKNSSSEESRRIYWESYYSLIQTLLNNGKKVYIVDPIPDLATHIDRYIYANKIYEKEKVDTIGPSVKFYKERNKFLLSKIESIQLSENLIRIQPLNVLSNNQTIIPIQNNKALYFDDNHLSLEGARLLVKEFFVN